MSIEPFKIDENIEDIPEFKDDPAYNFYYWGPLLMKYKVSNQFCDELLKRAEKLDAVKDDARHTLAADIQDEKKYHHEDREYFIKRTHKIFNSYMKFGREVWYKPNKNRIQNPSNINLSHFEITNMKLNGLWINKMKAREYNPPHEHDGDLSFVLFLQVPEELIEENSKNITTSSGPGMLNFLYGDGVAGYAGRQSFMPERGDFFIFPAKLLHFVAPFQSDVTRISVAGNMEFSYK